MVGTIYTNTDQHGDWQSSAGIVGIRWAASCNNTYCLWEKQLCKSTLTFDPVVLCLKSVWIFAC